jgi:hypothetical protein
MPQSDGRELIARCKVHVPRTMASLPECQSDQNGLGNAEIERAAGFDMSLPEQDHWFTWSLLQNLVADAKVDLLRRGPRRIRFYRLRTGGD